MREHPLFKTLNDKEYKIAVDFFIKRDVREGEIIVKEGDFSQKAFLLLEGEISVMKATVYEDEYVITNIKAPSYELFGEVNLIDRGLVSSTIKAAKNSKILEIDHNDFISLVDTYPQIGSKMLWIISYNLTKHLRRADKDVITLFNALVEVVEND